jgi:5-methyltetrahydrofolate--homocysteine methyltransferase
VKTRLDRLCALMASRIVVLDGATGTNLPAYGLETELTRAFIAAGADVIKTNSFNALPDAARQAAAAARVLAGDDIFVAGVIAPPYGTQDLLAATRIYAATAEALMAGGADVLLLETIFDTRLARAAIDAIAGGPAIFSATTDAAGRLPSGETMADFWNAVQAAAPLAIGLNCGFGAETIAAPLRQLVEIADVPVSCHPSAGLPDAGGRYPVDPDLFAVEMRRCAVDGLFSMVGGCCGTTPAHIAKLKAAMAGLKGGLRDGL